MTLLTTQRFDIIGHLPGELSQQVLGYLDLKDLSRCCEVSKVWKKFAEDDYLWARFVPQEMRYQQGLKAFLTSKGSSLNPIASPSEFEKQLGLFLKRIERGDRVELTCESSVPLFKFKLAIDFKDSQENSESPTSKEVWFVGPHFYSTTCEDVLPFEFTINSLQGDIFCSIRSLVDIESKLALQEKIQGMLRETFTTFQLTYHPWPKFLQKFEDKTLLVANFALPLLLSPLYFLERRLIPLSALGQIGIISYLGFLNFSHQFPFYATKQITKYDEERVLEENITLTFNENIFYQEIFAAIAMTMGSYAAAGGLLYGVSKLLNK